MNSNYNSRQCKIYSDYSPYSDQQLLDILHNEKNYIKEVIDIVIDILIEREKLPNNIKQEVLIKEEKEKTYNYASDLLLKYGKSSEEAIQLLIEHGKDSYCAEMIINDILSRENKEKKSLGKNKRLYGGFWLIGGILVSVISYSSLEGGGTFIIAWGAIFYGLFRFLRGLYIP
jgi:hypothetical protein